jgi:hypothetical protein
MPLETVTNVLGETRPVATVFGDGSVNCPFCQHPICVPKTACENPWCEAHPSMPPAAVLKRREQAAEKEREEKRRAEVAEFNRQYAAAEAERRKLEPVKASKSKSPLRKFTCGCTNVWAKTVVSAVCNGCSNEFTSEGSEDDDDA